MHPAHLKVAALFLCLVVSSACWWGRGGRDYRHGDGRDGRHEEHR